ncbi:unnamed protein product [Staurois parvus]|uniref:Uncharacterized protein n=1 Tax=Staurois parvus TaxID=386267 RepID=A0ABN9EI40_9NEOB|nr:unnamed protein product [Staurois parvus]
MKPSGAGSPIIPGWRGKDGRTASATTSASTSASSACPASPGTRAACGRWTPPSMVCSSGATTGGGGG